MAKYDFKCEKCDSVIELQMPIKDYDNVQLCKVCNGQMRRLPPSQTNFILKGTGWYKTDYQRNGR